MRMLTLISILILFTLQLKAPADGRVVIIKDDPVRPYERASKAVDIVETNCDPFAIGDTTLQSWSYGIKQIRQIKLDWYNDRTGNQYTLKDCFDVSVSNEIFMYHMMQYNDINLAIRRWNGSGKKTYKYLAKVSKHL